MMRYTFYHGFRSVPYPKEPFVLDYRMYDITPTIVSALKLVPEHCVAISINFAVGRKTREIALEMMRARNIKIIWWDKELKRQRLIC